MSKRPILLLLTLLLATGHALAAERTFALLSVPARSTVPDWAQPGKMRYARCDGGPVEVCKAFMSGWLQIREPDAIVPCVTVYNDRTIDMFKQAGINWVWVTWSVGFSAEAEAQQRQMLRPFIAKCNAAGIRVSAYVSLTNMFIDDMTQRVPAAREWMQIELDGTPRPYGAAKYDGKPTRIIACLNHPEWLQYSRRRLNEAIEAGVSAIFYDNCAQGCKCPVCRDKFARATEAIYGKPLPVPGQATFDASRNTQGREEVEAKESAALAERAWHRFCLQTVADALAGHSRYAEALKPGILVYANTHQQLLMNDGLNAIFSEDGIEPGMKGPQLRSNIGLFKYFYAEGDGAKPIRVENGKRMHDDRMDGPMPPRNLTLAVYEAAACQAAMQTFLEMGWTTRLAQNDPKAHEALRALGVANAWLRDHESLFAQMEPIAKTALVLPGFKSIAPVVCEGKNFVVLQPKHLTAEQLAQFELVVLDDVRFLSDVQIQAVLQYVKSGGRLIATDQTARYDDRTLDLRPAPGLAPMFGDADPGTQVVQKQFGSGHCTYCPRAGDTSRLLEAWQRLEGKPLVTLQGGDGVVCFNLARSYDGRRTLVYLLNYSDSPVQDLHVTLNLSKPVHTVRVLAPGSPTSQADASPGPDGLVVPVAKLDVLTVLEVE